jgi:hypothetical protein
VPNELSGQFVNVDASKIVKLFTLEAENAGSADDRDMDAFAVEDISVHGNPIFASSSARADQPAGSVILLLQNHPNDEDQCGDDAN